MTIKGVRGTFSPTAVTATPKKFTSCTANKVDLVIDNKSATAKSLTYEGTTFVTIAAHTKDGICEDATAGYVFVFGIVGSKSTLSVTMS